MQHRGSQNRKKKSDINDHTKELREKYAKIALLMFYPHRDLSVLKKHGSYWRRFYSELKIQKLNVKQDDPEKRKKTTFWEYGFTILQNIQDRKVMDKSLKRAIDHITRGTICREPDVGSTTTKNTTNVNNVPDISELCKPER